MEKTVVELFAGVGGFRVGLNNITRINKNGLASEHGQFSFVWSNQWEPSTKKQHAYECYTKRFGEKDCSNQDISTVEKENIPNHTLLCGGFPCQDYSVAHTLSHSKGINGKKGVLWWQINDILLAKKPPFVLLENVDRLLKSPAKQRGRDFAIMLRCFSDNGYVVEWRVINAADYGHPQKRRRIFIFASHSSTKNANIYNSEEPEKTLLETGIFPSIFRVIKAKDSKLINHDIVHNFKDLVSISEKFSGKFENSGFMTNGKVYTIKTAPIQEPITPLKQLVENNVSEEYYLNEQKLIKFKYLRGSKKVKRTSKSGFEYNYSEGAMRPVDDLSLPARTMLTSEGTTNRSTHIIQDPQTNKIRLLTPIECERINQFPDNWTDTGMPNRRRYFMMGNALVCGIIKKLGKAINTIIENEE